MILGMKVALAPGLDEFVAMKAKSGDYQDAAEVIRESLRRWKQDENSSSLEPEWLEQEILEGLESPEMPVNGAFWKDLREELAQESRRKPQRK
jgi:putative addiction module CopG family antidote